MAYLAGQDWKASVSGHSEKEGDWKRAVISPSLFSPIRFANCAAAITAAVHRLWSSGHTHPPHVGVALPLPRLGTGTRSTAQSVVSRRHTEDGSGAGRTAGMCLFQQYQNCHEARVVLAREQRAPMSMGRPKATSPRAPCDSSPGTEESRRKCCTCCYFLHAPSRRPASHTLRPQHPGEAPRCYWRSRSSGQRPARWRWPEPGGKPRELLGWVTSA